MPQPPLSTRLLRFGTFEVDLQRGELRKKGVRLKLQSQPFLMLVTLLKQGGSVVTREELRATLWPDGAFVDFDHSLSTAVNKLREVLGDSATSPRFIETIPRRGYRFIAPVHLPIGEQETATIPGGLPLESQPEPSSGAAPLADRKPENAPTAAPVKPWHWILLWKALGMILLLAVLAGLCIKVLRPVPPRELHSLAVLPLQNLSGNDSQDYFSDGMTDELITKLGQISELRVISRSSVMSYKQLNKPIRQIGRELGVDAVIEGTVLRSGKQFRITARLIDAPSDRNLWAHDYVGDLDNTLSVQNQVARDIADRIKVKLTSEERSAFKKSRIIDPEAHEAYLKGRYFWNKRTADNLKKAEVYFQLASAKDPNYAEAFSGLADTYALMGDWEYGVLNAKEMLPKAREAATKALALDSSLSEAHTSLAFALDVYDWDWKAAENEFERAIQLNPNYATARQWYAWHLAVVGQNPQAVKEMKRAEALDPLSLIISADMADILLIARRLDESVQQSRKTLEMDPRFAIAHYELGQALAQQHRFADALHELRLAASLSGDSNTFASSLAYVYAVSGNTDKARHLLTKLMNAAQGFSNSSEIALVYVGLRDNNQAMLWLEKAYKERFNPSILLRPCFDPLRSDPRFQDLMRRISANN